MPLRIVSWNIQRLEAPWRVLAADTTFDVALLQEAVPPPPDVTLDVWPQRGTRWGMAGYTHVLFCAAIARCSDRVRVTARPTAPIGSPQRGAIELSRDGTVAIADVEHAGESITVASVYSCWESPPGDAERRLIYADASVHRIISDLSALITSRRGHRIIVAGDFNIVFGYGEDGNAYWKGRYDTVFARMEALGLRFVGPEAPDGRQADPWPEELPRTSRNVPTYHTSRQTPATATRQLDFVFASESLASRVRTRALNGPEEWGPSDHCRVAIEVGAPT